MLNNKNNRQFTPLSANMYKLSMFNIYIELDRFNDSIGVYNTLHDSAIVVDKEIIDNLRKNTKYVDCEITDSLLSNRFIVPFEFDERKYFRYFINKIKYSPRHVTFVIMLTSQCNLECEYCFEGKDKERAFMSDETEEMAVEFILKIIHKNSSINDIYIAFFGGEPFLNRRIMYKMCEDIDRCIDNVNYTITSNLTLCNDNDFEFMKEHNFLNVQVALDGSEEVHNKRRVDKSGNGTFNIIIENLLKLYHSGIGIIVFLNYDNENSYRELIPQIKETLPYKDITFLLNPIIKSLCNTTCNIPFMNTKDKMSVFKELYNQFKHNGIQIDAFRQTDMLCIMNTDLSCIIGPEGLLYKCGIFIGNCQYSIGDLKSQSFNTHYYDAILNEPWLQCLNMGCKYLPICGAGCRALALLNEKSLSAVYCLKEDYFANVFPDILRDHFSHLMDGGGKDERAKNNRS